MGTLLLLFCYLGFFRVQSTEGQPEALECTPHCLHLEAGASLWALNVLLPSSSVEVERDLPVPAKVFFQ